MLHKALRRRSDLTDVDRLATCRAQDVAAARSPARRRPDPAHLQVTSSTDRDVTVPPEVVARESGVPCRRAPPPYELRPRRQNDDEHTVSHHPWSGRPTFSGGR